MGCEVELSDIRKIGIAGGGTMGFGLAINFALWGYPTTIYDLNDPILEQTSQRVKKALDMFVTEDLISRKRSEDTFKRITFTPDINKLADSDFITEAIVERLPDKQELFNKLNKICKPQTIIASNTSSLQMGDIAKSVTRQDKVVLTHYFTPPHIVPGVEVAKGPGTTDETFNLTYDLLKKVKKTPVRVLKEFIIPELPGYLLNTMQRALEGAAYRLWAEGVASAEDIDLGIKASFGFRNPHEGPFMHADFSAHFRWPDDVQARQVNRILAMPGLSEEAKERLRKRFAKGVGTWFIDPNKYEEAEEVRDRQYARRLKELYWGKLD
jgi:3-hydroxybutyryl-CoA dehydrogenase